ncbi:MAG TPA: hypothetical protein VJT84_03165 [Gaiellaceae bacterium]|nr:hypothetical protein [Gaiellaceae bacterium]
MVLWIGIAVANVGSWILFAWFGGVGSAGDAVRRWGASVSRQRREQPEQRD